MSIVSGGSPTLTTNQAVAYSNIFETGTVTASSTATGSFVENAYDWLEDNHQFNSGTSHTYTVDYGSAVNVDVFCLAYHNWGALSATVTIRYSTDNFAADDNIALTLSPADDSVIFRTFTSQNKRYWRVQIDLGAAGQPYAGQILLSEMVNLPKAVRVGAASIYDSDNDDIINNIAQNGNFIGMSRISQGVKGSIKFEFMTEQYLRNQYRAFKNHASIKPFFYSWRPTLYDDDAIICWRSGQIPDAVSTHAKPYYSVDFPIEGRR